MNRFTVPAKRDIPSDSSEITVIILSAGLRYRKKSCGPSLLLKDSKGDTVLDSHMNSIRTVLPKSEIFITVGFDANKIINKRPENTRIVENQLWDRTNETEEIRLALNCCNTPNVLVIQDDITFNHEVLQQCITATSSIAISNQEGLEKCFGSVCVNNSIKNLSYGIDNYVLGMYYINGKELEGLRKLCNRKNSHKMFAETMNDLINRAGTKLQPTLITKGKFEKL